MNEVGLAKGKTLEKVKSYAGWGIGLLSLCIAIYAEFIKKESPQFEYDIVSSTKFINNSETSANLKIIVDSLDIQRNALNVSAFTIKVENKGTANIRYDDYDKGKFGLLIQDARLLEPPALIESSTDHIKELFPQMDSLIDSSFVEIPSLSLDIDDYYILRLVLLHSDSSVPSFISEGKIVGQKKIDVNTLRTPTPSFWADVISGNWLVHIVRCFIYLICLTLFSLLVAFTASKIDEMTSKQKRKKHIAELSKKSNIESFVADDYINNGEYEIVRMNNVYNRDVSDLSKKYKKSKGYVNSTRALEMNNRRESRFHRDRYMKIQRMIEMGYLVLNADDTVSFNQGAKQSVNSIYSMLASKDLLKKFEVHDVFFTGEGLMPIQGDYLYRDRL